MGNNNQSQPLMDSSYQYMSSTIDENYGEAKVYRKRGANDLVAVISRSAGSNLDQRFNQIQERQSMINKYMLNVFGSKKVVANDLCSGINLLQVIVEYLPTNLVHDFQDRLNDNLYYDESEIWFIILSLVEALIFLQQNQEEYLDLHPTRILITEHREIKLMDQYLQNESLPNYQQVRMGLRPFQYIAPEQIKLFTSSNQIQRLNKEKINVFNIGLICVQLITMQGVDDFYVNNQFNGFILQERLEKSCKRFKYSKYLHEIVDQMIQVTPEQRPDYVTLMEEIQMIPKDQLAQALLSSSVPVSPRQQSSQYSRKAGESQVLFQSPLREIPSVKSQDFNTVNALLGQDNVPNVPIMPYDSYEDQQQAEQQKFDQRILDVIKKSKMALEMHGDNLNQMDTLKKSNIINNNPNGYDSRAQKFDPNRINIAHTNNQNSNENETSLKNNNMLQIETKHYTQESYNYQNKDNFNADLERIKHINNKFQNNDNAESRILKDFNNKNDQRINFDNVKDNTKQITLSQLQIFPVTASKQDSRQDKLQFLNPTQANLQNPTQSQAKLQLSQVQQQPQINKPYDDQRIMDIIKNANIEIKKAAGSSSRINVK